MKRIFSFLMDTRRNWCKSFSIDSNIHEFSELKNHLPKKFQSIMTSATLDEDMTELKKMFASGSVVSLKLKVNLNGLLLIFFNFRKASCRIRNSSHSIKSIATEMKSVLRSFCHCWSWSCWLERQSFSFLRLIVVTSEYFRITLNQFYL